MNAHPNAIGSETVRPGTRWRTVILPALRARVRLSVEQVVELSRLWLRRRRQRRLLATFDSRMLADIGLTPAESWREVRKPFWLA